MAEDQNIFLETLSLLAETYVVVFVAAPLFLITIIIVLGIMKPFTPLFLYSIVYGLILGGTSILIALLHGISASGEEKGGLYVEIKKLNVYDDVPIKGKGNEELIKVLRRYEKVERIKKFLRDPFLFFYHQPSRIFAFTLPIAASYLILPGYDSLVSLIYHRLVFFFS
ncbi:MAG: hypothetical protein ACXQT5_06250 [Candidatus Syntropharchaeia archaeon]